MSGESSSVIWPVVLTVHGLLNLGCRDARGLSHDRSIRTPENLRTPDARLGTYPLSSWRGQWELTAARILQAPQVDDRSVTG